MNCIPCLVDTQPTHIPQYVIDTIMGDGNCFFRAILKEMFGTEDHHFALRTTITAHIATDHQFRSILLPLSDFDTDDELQDDIDRMKTNGHWAGTWVIFAMATYLQTPIDIYIYIYIG